jgi:hypothetical protein
MFGKKSASDEGSIEDGFSSKPYLERIDKTSV